MPRKETVEYQVGEVNLTTANLLVTNITDMEVLEYWEERLTKLEQPFAITFKKRKGKIRYSVYTNLRGKDSPFRGNHV